MIAEVTDVSINEFIKDTDVSVVVFSADWCGPCRVLTPVLDVLSQENEGVNIGKVNVELQPQSVMKYGISGIPAIFFFKGGLVVDKIKGGVSKGVLQDKINGLK